MTARQVSLATLKSTIDYHRDIPAFAWTSRFTQKLQGTIAPTQIQR